MRGTEGEGERGRAIEAVEGEDLGARPLSSVGDGGGAEDGGGEENKNEEGGLSRSFSRRVFFLECRLEVGRGKTFLQFRSSLLGGRR